MEVQDTPYLLNCVWVRLRRVGRPNHQLGVGSVQVGAPIMHHTVITLFDDRKRILHCNDGMIGNAVRNRNAGEAFQEGIAGSHTPGKILLREYLTHATDASEDDTKNNYLLT